MHDDLEKGPHRPQPARLDGFPAFAEFMRRANRYALFHRFQGLGMRVLLYEQSRLNALQTELNEVDALDYGRAQTNSSFKATAKDWQVYQNDQEFSSKRRRDLMQQIKEKLENYQRYLLLQSETMSLRSPSKINTVAFQSWYRSRNPQMLCGNDRYLYDDADDLVALSPYEDDGIVLFLRRWFSCFFAAEEVDIVENEVKMRLSNERALQRAADIISVFLSTLLLVVPTSLLLKLCWLDIGRKIAIVTCFVALFAFAVGILTKARRAELFAGTAAYAAVLVVFFQIGGGQGCQT